MLLALAFALADVLTGQATAPPVPAAPAAPTAPDTLVVVDDRAVKDQAPAPFLERVIAELKKRKGLRIERMSEGRKRLDAREDKALTTCGDDAGCLATAGREMGAATVVFARLTKRDDGGTGAYFVAVTRVNALRPQAADDAGTLAGTEADALAAMSDAISELFSEVELR